MAAFGKMGGLSLGKTNETAEIGDARLIIFGL
jgi:hypothetical protein